MTRMTKCSVAKTHYWIVRSEGGRASRRPGVLLGKLYRECRHCGEFDRETPLCEGTTADHSSRAPSYGTCGSVASYESPYKPSLLGTLEMDGVQHHYCKRHEPEIRKARSEARSEAASVKYRAELDARAWGWYGGALKTAAKSYLEWAATNEDLVEGDEWLKQITASIRVAISKG